MSMSPSCAKERGEKRGQDARRAQVPVIGENEIVRTGCWKETRSLRGSPAPLFRPGLDDRRTHTGR